MAIACANPKSRRNNINFHPFFNGILNEFMNPPATRTSRPEQTKTARVKFSQPAVNILEEKERFVIEMAVPGLTKENININLEKKVLKVEANEATENPEGERIVKKEFNYFGFSRNFTLPKTVDTLKIEGKVENGILEIVLPKKEEAIDKGPVSINVL